MNLFPHNFPLIFFLFFSVLCLHTVLFLHLCLVSLWFLLSLSSSPSHFVAAFPKLTALAFPRGLRTLKCGWLEKEIIRYRRSCWKTTKFWPEQGHNAKNSQYQWKMQCQTVLHKISLLWKVCSDTAPLLAQWAEGASGKLPAQINPAFPFLF